MKQANQLPKQDETPQVGADSSRNTRYEHKKRSQGLDKVTLWVPTNLVVEFKMLADACCTYRHLSFNTLRDTKSGKYVSLERL